MLKVGSCLTDIVILLASLCFICMFLSLSPFLSSGLVSSDLTNYPSFISSPAYHLFL